MELPKIEFIESQGTRWAASELRYLLALGETEIKSELKRLIGVAEDPVAVTAESTSESKEP